MITKINLVDNSEQTLKPGEVKELKLENTWIDLKDPNEAEMKAILEKLDMPLNIVKPADLSTMADIHFAEESIVMYFASIGPELDPKNVTPITMIFSKNSLVTVRMKDMNAIDKAKKRLHKSKADSPCYVIYSIVDEMVTEYYTYLELVEDETAELEEKILENQREEILKDMFRLKSKLISFNKLLWYERGALFSLKKTEKPFVTSKMRTCFDDLHDDLARQIDIVETFREILSDGLDAYLSKVSNTINLSIKNLTTVMLYLTIITTVTTFPNTIATIFGIPVFGTNTDWRIILLLLALSTVFPLIWLLKKKWMRYE